MKQHLTRTELEEACKALNKFHRVLWTIVAVGIFVGACIKNPAHIITACLVFGFSRCQWEVNDIEAIWN